MYQQDNHIYIFRKCMLAFYGNTSPAICFGIYPTHLAKQYLHVCRVYITKLVVLGWFVAPQSLNNGLDRFGWRDTSR
jgi:hypothetical protein